MHCQIRRSIHETSSSSCSTFTMVSDKGVHTRVKLDKPWLCVSAAYHTDWDGCPHEYLTRWQEKMSFLARDTAQWHKMFRRVTGQSFRLYSLFAPIHNGSFVTPGSIPGALQVESDPETGQAKVRGMDYICGCGLLGQDWVVALPGDTSDDFLREYDLTPCFSSIYTLVSPQELENLFGENELDDRMLEEIIFNPAIAFDIGGDAYEGDYGRGVLNGLLSSGEKNSPLAYAGYTFLDKVFHNGNETLILGKDGSKIRFCREEEQQPEYPDSIDMKITDCCYNDCPFCYENCTFDGKHGEIPEALFSSIPEFTEIAIGGGNALLHPEIFRLREKYHLRMNLTLHAQDFLGSCWSDDPLYGEPALLKFDAVGVSVSSVEMAEQLAEFKEKREEYFSYHWDNIYSNSDYSATPREDWDKYSQLVVHVVNGIVTEEILKPLYDKNLRLLVLGYKTKGRGIAFAKNKEVAVNQKWLHDNIIEVAKHFVVTAFDTLALEQLEIRQLMSDDEWRHFYMGEDGTHSMYIDLVNKEYGISSTDDRRWQLTDDLKEMFRHVRSVVAQDKAERILYGNC